MRLRKDEIDGIQFFHREGYSDMKTFEEVIGRRVYEKRGMKIESGENWMDAGANVGAFSLFAAARGASVTAYEPDPFNCELIEKNARLNGFEIEVKQAALVADNRETATMFVGNNQNVWRNSLVKKWNELGLEVPCLNFDSEAVDFDHCKMDIEGSEMPILEATEKRFKKLCYEWSFDIDPSLSRLWKVIDKQKNQGYRVEAAWRSICYDDQRFDLWQPAWFPACTNVFCFQ